MKGLLEQVAHTIIMAIIITVGLQMDTSSMTQFKAKGLGTSEANGVILSLWLKGRTTGIVPRVLQPKVSKCTTTKGNCPHFQKEQLTCYVCPRQA